MTMPNLSKDGAVGLVFSLILSMDKRGILKQSEFIADLGEVVRMLKSSDFLPQEVAEELSAMHSYLEGRERPAH
jgi:hypothetical protein